MGERIRFNSKDSVDSRSHSFDSRSGSFDSRSGSFDSRSGSFDSSYITDLSNCIGYNKTKSLVIPINVKIKKTRKRDQSLTKPITPSPVPDKSLYLFNKYFNDNNNK